MAQAPLKMLVIDDEPIILESYLKVFSPLRAEFDVTTAPSGEAGLAKLRETPFDLVITDLKMPGLDGLGVLEQGRKIRPDTDFAMMTGYASVDSAVGAMKFGATDFIEKPFSQDELVRFVRSLAELRFSRIRKREEEAGFERFSRPMLTQHIVLILTFTLLSITGVPLFFPETFKGVFFFDDSSYLRGLMHRISAVGLMFLSFYHIGYILLTEDGNKNLRAILPSIPKDLKEAGGNIMFTFGLRKDRPKAGKYSFFEKFEYFGVVWGSLVMVLTGLVMWFKDQVLLIAPLWFFDVAKVVHRYEAILAILMIAIWHMYNVHLKAGVFPMSRIWLTGRISRAEMLHEHPLEFEALTGRSADAEHGAGGPDDGKSEDRATRQGGAK